MKIKKTFKLVVPIFCLLSVLFLVPKVAYAAEARQLTQEEESKALKDVWGKPLNTHKRYKLATNLHNRRGIGCETSFFVDYARIESNSNEYSNQYLDQPMSGMVLRLDKHPWNPNFDDMVSVGNSTVPYAAILNPGDRITIQDPNKEIDNVLSPSSFNGKSWTAFAGDANAAAYQQFELGIAEGFTPSKSKISLKNMKTNGYLYDDYDGWIRSDGTETKYLDSQWLFVPVDDSGNLLDGEGNILKQTHF